MVTRLLYSREHVKHPLLLPGIFAELERIRMHRIVDETINVIEGAIFELNQGQIEDDEDRLCGDVESGSGSIIDSRLARRNAWLDTTFLRNSLRIWKKQLGKMAEHADELSSPKFSIAAETGGQDSLDDANDDDGSMERTGKMIKDRLRAIIEEYNDKIYECSMSVEGMAIATQWVREHFLG